MEWFAMDLWVLLASLKSMGRYCASEFTEMFC